MMSIEGNIEESCVRQKRVRGDKAVFYRESGKILRIIGVLSDDEMSSDFSLLEESSKQKIRKVIEELENDKRRNSSV